MKRSLVSTIRSLSGQRTLSAFSKTSKLLSQTLFSDQAHLYAQFRPDYPQRIFDLIENYSRENGNIEHSVAVDFATGNGQAAKSLAKSFTRVIGVDLTSEQLQHAQKELPNIQFHQGKAEESGLEDNFADLITVAQALHWFDIPKFYQDAHRILKRNGTISVFGYDCAFISSKSESSASSIDVDRAKEASKLLQSVYDDPPIGPYWDVKRKLIDTHLQGCEPPTTLFSNVKRDSLIMSKPITLPQLVGYIRTWSSFNSFLRAHPEITLGSKDDPSVIFQKKMETLYQIDTNYKLNSVNFHLSFPVFILFGTKK